MCPVGWQKLVSAVGDWEYVGGESVGDVVVALLVAVRRLSVCGAFPATKRSARQLLVGASVVPLVLNVAEPLSRSARGAARWLGCRVVTN
ncbi:hypothetical protein DMP23_12545 [Amycolatopsis sp. A1MSW2902]